jgi:uncharacterized lipoprotein YddW (UPF0748 family)
MAAKKSNKSQGCGCASIPIIPFILLLSGGGWWTWQNKETLSQYLPQSDDKAITEIVKKTPETNDANSPKPTPKVSIEPSPSVTPTVTSSNSPSPKPTTQAKVTPSKNIGIYLSRYQITNNTDEATIRQRVRFYRSQGITTIVHGVWGNGCTMYRSEVTERLLGQQSCPNQFQESWLDWLIDEASKQGIEVHAYFEKGIKIDRNSPIYQMAIEKKWLVSGVDKTYSGIDHYVLDVENPEVAKLFKEMLAEFAGKYPQVKAVQWDDYLGYYAGLSDRIDRTAKLSKFVKEVIAEMKRVNPAMSFDICHHNPYWSKRYFAADWQNWQVDRAFIQAYNETNFQNELVYAEKYNGIALTDRQLQHVPALMKNSKIKTILIFPFSGNPEVVAEKFKAAIEDR